MSSITFAPGYAPAMRPVLRLTRRGRLVFLGAFLAIIAIAMVSTGAMASAGFGRGQAPSVRVVEVQPGQTLFDLARQVGGDNDIRDTIARIEQLNSLPGPELQVGQRIALPQ